MNTNPLISVVINCYNGERYLREAIESVYAQTYSNWEIIFWDNASVDASAAIARSYDSRLHYLYGKQLAPLYTARNSALEHCNGDAVSFLDCDDIWLRNKLERQVEIFRQGNPFVYGGYEIINSNGKQTGQVEDSNPSGQLTRSLLRKNTISIGCVMIETSLIRHYLFDPTYELLGDFDLWVRLSLDHPVASVKGIVELSRQHRENLSDIRRERWLCERRYFYRKFMRNASFFRHPEIFWYIAKTEIKGLLNAR